MTKGVKLFRSPDISVKIECVPRVPVYVLPVVFFSVAMPRRDFRFEELFYLASRRYETAGLPLGNRSSGDYQEQLTQHFEIKVARFLLFHSSDTDADRFTRLPCI